MNRRQRGVALVSVIQSTTHARIGSGASIGIGSSGHLTVDALGD